jgi:hypothetical protein
LNNVPYHASSQTPNYQQPTANSQHQLPTTTTITSHQPPTTNHQSSTNNQQPTIDKIAKNQEVITIKCRKINKLQ